MTLTEYEKLVRKYHADRVAKYAHVYTPPEHARADAAKEERMLQSVLNSERARKRIALMPSVAEVAMAVRRFVESRIRSRTLKLKFSAPEFGGTFQPLNENFRIERKWPNDHPYELHVQFEVTVTIQRGNDKSEERIFVEHGKGNSWQIRSGALNARKFHDEFNARKQHVVVLAVMDRAVADEAVRRARELGMSGDLGQRGLAGATRAGHARTDSCAREEGAGTRTDLATTTAKTEAKAW